MFKEIWYGLNARVDRLFDRIFRLPSDDGIFWTVGPGDWPEEDVIVEKTERKYDKRRFLKIKLKSLMAEVKIIREQEEKLKPAARRGSDGARAMIEEMAKHRRRDIREESRATLLAYNFIRGRTYQQTEPRAKPEASFYLKERIEKVSKMARRYGQVDWSPEKVREWMGFDKDFKKVV